MTGVGRSAEQVNAEIRALWSGGVLAAEDVQRYHRLLVEWSAAVRAERAARGEQRLAA